MDNFCNFIFFNILIFKNKIFIFKEVLYKIFFYIKNALQ